MFVQQNFGETPKRHAIHLHRAPVFPRLPRLWDRLPELASGKNISMRPSKQGRAALFRAKKCVTQYKEGAEDPDQWRDFAITSGTELKECEREQAET